MSADVLREAVRLRVESSSLRLAAGEIGVSHSALRAFLNGSEPYGRNLTKLRECTGARRTSCCGFDRRTSS